MTLMGWQQGTDPSLIDQGILDLKIVGTSSNDFLVVLTSTSFNAPDCS